MAATAGACRGITESLQHPSPQRAATAAAEAKCQQGAWPKTQTKWLATQELYRAEEDTGYQSAFQEQVRKCMVTSMREEGNVILKWRSMGPLDLSELGEWKYQTVTHSQTLEGLPEKVGQLSLGSVGQHQPCSQVMVLLGQPTFMFPT